MSDNNKAGNVNDWDTSPDTNTDFGTTSKQYHQVGDVDWPAEHLAQIKGQDMIVYYTRFPNVLGNDSFNCVIDADDAVPEEILKNEAQRLTKSVLETLIIRSKFGM